MPCKLYALYGMGAGWAQGKAAKWWNQFAEFGDLKVHARELWGRLGFDGALRVRDPRQLGHLSLAGP